MPDHSEDRAHKDGLHAAARPHRSLANEILSRVADDSDTLRLARRQSQIDRLCDAARNPDHSDRDAAVAEILNAGVSEEVLIDDRIPAAARELGQRWRRDELGFADVTIAVARLQGILRDLSSGRQSLILTTREQGLQIAMVVPEEEHHTLGALVATNQMRRSGRAVRLLLGKPMAEVAEDIVTYGIDVVMISASVSMRLEAIQALVDTIRIRTRARVPIVVGGSILSHHPNVKSATGADLTSNDTKHALSLCEQTIQQNGASSCATWD